MLEKKVEVTNHFVRQFQKRAKNHCSRPTHKNVKIKVKNIIEQLNEEDLIRINGNYFARVMLNRECIKPFYFIFADDNSHLSLLTLYTEDMFLKMYGNKKLK